jgi:hypothetical protein
MSPNGVRRTPIPRSCDAHYIRKIVFSIDFSRLSSLADNREAIHILVKHKGMKRKKGVFSHQFSVVSSGN